MLSILARVRSACPALEPTFNDGVPCLHIAAAAQAGQLDSVVPPKVLAAHTELRDLSRALTNAGASYGGPGRDWLIQWPECPPVELRLSSRACARPYGGNGAVLDLLKEDSWMAAPRFVYCAKQRLRICTPSIAAASIQKHSPR